MTLTVAEPFCGAGGLGLGLKAAGFTCVWAADANAYARASFAAAFGIEPAGEVTGEEPLPDGLDLLAGGPPCQPFSSAGLGQGQWDPRDGFPLFLRLVSRAQPRAILLENVKGLLSPKHRPYFEAVLARPEVLLDLGRGGVAGDKASSRAKSLLYKLTPPDVPADTVSAAAEQKGSEHCARIALEVKGGRFRRDVAPLDGPGPTVAASWAKDPPCVVGRNLGAGDGPGAHLDDVAPTVPAKVGGQSGLALMDGASTREWVGAEGTTEPGRVHRRPDIVVRRLATTEVARLQAFPDGYPFQGPTTQIYRQIGNAVPPPLAEAVGRAIVRVLEE